MTIATLIESDITKISYLVKIPNDYTYNVILNYEYLYVTIHRIMETDIYGENINVVYFYEKLNSDQTSTEYKNIIKDSYIANSYIIFFIMENILEWHKSEFRDQYIDNLINGEGSI